MISAEYSADLLKREVGKLSDYEYRNMTRAGDTVGLFLGLYILDRYSVLLAHVEKYFFYHRVVGNISGIDDGDNIVDRLLGDLKTGE